MNNVLNLRKQKGMTQDEFAEFCDVSRASIARYETGGNVNRENAEKIAKACLVSVDWVIGHEGKQRPHIDAKVQAMINDLVLLSPQEQQRVADFVSGILSSHAQ